MSKTFKSCFMIIMVLGILIYLPLMNGFNAWFDEQWSLYITSLSWSDMIRIIMQEDGSPPLFYILLRLWMMGMDYHTVGWARLLSVVCISLTALMGAFPVRRLCGDKSALWFTAFCFLFPTMIYLGTDIRMYAMLNLEITALTVYALLILKENKLRDWIYFCLFGILAPYTHYFGGLALFVIGAFLFIMFLCRRKNLWGNVGKLSICAIIVSIAFIPWFIGAFLGQTAHMYKTWYPSMGYVFGTLGVFFNPYLNSVNIFGKTIMTLFMGLCWLLAIEAVCNKANGVNRSRVMLPLILYVGVITLGIIISYALRPMMSSRYMMPFAGSLCLGLAIILSWEERFKKIFIVLGLISFSFFYINRFEAVHDTFYQKFQTGIQQEFSPKETIFLCGDIHSAMMIHFYLPEYRWQRAPFEPELAVPKHLMYRESVKDEDLNSAQHIFFLRKGFGVCKTPFLDKYYYSSESCLIPLSVEDAKKMIANSKKVMYNETH